LNPCSYTLNRGRRNITVYPSAAANASHRQTPPSGCLGGTQRKGRNQVRSCVRSPSSIPQISRASRILTWSNFQHQERPQQVLRPDTESATKHRSLSSHRPYGGRHPYNFLLFKPLKPTMLTTAVPQMSKWQLALGTESALVSQSPEGSAYRGGAHYFEIIQMLGSVAGYLRGMQESEQATSTGSASS
jgi:hypothetical protein